MMRFGVSLALLVLIVDQITKQIIVGEVMQPPRVIEVTGFLNLVMVWNRGISFGMLAGQHEAMRWVLSAVALAITVVLVLWLRRMDRRWPAAAVGLVIGGAVGNVIDRFRYGAVADFVDLHVFGYHWPAFNVADAAISVGVVLLLIDSFVGEGSRPEGRKQKSGQES